MFKLYAQLKTFNFFASESLHKTGLTLFWNFWKPQNVREKAQCHGKVRELCSLGYLILTP